MPHRVLQDGDAGGEGGLCWTSSRSWEQTSLPSRFGLLVLTEPFERGDDCWRAAGPAVRTTVAGPAGRSTCCH